MKATNMQANVFTKGRLWVILAVVGVAVCSNRASAVGVTAGDVLAVDGDSIQEIDFAGMPGVRRILRFNDSGTNSVASAVLDLGSVQQVIDIAIQNRLDTPSNLNAGQLQIFVAPDESAGGFDPTMPSSFTDMVFDNRPSPISNATGLVRTAALTTTSTKQYFLLDFRGNLNVLLADGGAVDTGDLLLNQSNLAPTVGLNFFEDFSGTAPNFNFTTSVLAGPPPPNEWFVGSGILSLVSPGVFPEGGVPASLSAASVRVEDDLSSTDIAISATFFASDFDGSADIGLALFGEDETFDFTAGVGHYLADFKPNGDARILRIDPDTGAVTTIATASGLFTFDTSETYTLTVEAKRSGADLDLTLFIDDPSLPALVSVSGTDTSPLAGQNFGIRTRTAGSINQILAGFDDFRIIESVDGDFDFDADVDGFDFLRWQRGGSPNPLSPSDLADWEAGFGTSGGPLSGLAASVGAVPEPTTTMLMFIGLAFTMLLPRNTFRNRQKKLAPVPQPSTLRLPLSAFLPVLLITGFLSSTTFAAHPSATPVPAGYLDAASFGYNTTDATNALQFAINQGQNVFVPNMGTDWNVQPIFLRSNQNILFEDGTVIQAKSDYFRGGNDALFKATDVENVTMTGYGVTLRMNQSDYTMAPYGAAEWRHGIDLERVRNVEIKGFRIEDTGGDGIYVGSLDGGVAMGEDDFSENVLIQDVFIENAYRNGISVISAKDLVIDNAVIIDTGGTSPEGGIDFEPNGPTQRLENIVLKNSIIYDNANQGLMFILSNLDGTSVPVTGTVENLTIVANGVNGVRMNVPEVPGLTIRDLLVVDNGGVGFFGAQGADPVTTGDNQVIDFSAFSGNTTGAVSGLAELGPNSITSTAPVFVSTDPNNPQFMFLDPSTSALITAGASDGGTMGARPVFPAALAANGSAIPEPSTSLLLLMGVGLGSLMPKRRKLSPDYSRARSLTARVVKDGSGRT